MTKPSDEIGCIQGGMAIDSMTEPSNASSFNWEIWYVRTK